jgi:acyl-CoA reductase-like NAD-dependent aldehyde dehydrogenase
VVGCIVPRDYPILLMARKVALALAAGNTVALKPSELIPLTTLRLTEVATDHLLSGGGGGRGLDQRSPHR